MKGAGGPAPSRCPNARARPLAKPEAPPADADHFRALVENSALGIYRTTPDGRILLANPALVRMLGYSSFAELSGRNLGVDGFEPCHPRARFLEAINRDGRVRGFESAWTRRDGSVIFLRESAVAVRGRDGAVRYYDGMVEDVSERRQAESQRPAALEALRQSEERLQLVLATLPVAIFTSPVDPGVDADWISGDVEKVTGYTPAQYLGEPDFWRKRLHAEDRERVLAAYREPSAREEIVLEYRWLCRDGAYKWFHDYTIRKATPQGSRYVGIILDISERKQAEEENRVLQKRLQWAEKMEAIGTLAGGIAHDFNNLLAAIQGHVSLAGMSLAADAAARQRLRQIEAHVQSGAQLTGQLLAFARGGRCELKAIDLDEVIRRTADLFGRTRREITLHLKPGPGVWSVEADRGQMEQVFLNLFVNAWQAMPAGGDIFVATENLVLQQTEPLPFSVKPGRYVKTTVTDTGSGMDEPTRLRVFEPFFTTKELGRGTGLGLASVYGIVKGHRGMINVYSEPGRGATFTLYLPASDKAAVKEEPAQARVVRGTETLLLVEDEDALRELNRELLESLGYTVLTAGSGREAVAIFAEKRGAIDLVILDMVMPGMSGARIFERLRAMEPVVKILLSSGYSLNGEAQGIMDRGCNGFLQKPFALEQLSLKIREILDSDPRRPGSGS